ncbi:unnamed protein product [Owenia fusiformis]|uniref:RING-type domain-containing protein n=1 Tax=Owenia fusiformis TaxID=6347 RepID=A0A8S4N1R7_OWEFU|nr:unnamed protein product [Owenia fusiformis]
MSDLRMIFAQIDEKYLKKSVLHSSNRQLPYSKNILLQRCIDDILDERTKNMPDETVAKLGASPNHSFVNDRQTNMGTANRKNDEDKVAAAPDLHIEADMSDDSDYSLSSQLSEDKSSNLSDDEDLIDASQVTGITPKRSKDIVSGRIIEGGVEKVRRQSDDNLERSVTTLNSTISLLETPEAIIHSPMIKPPTPKANHRTTLIKPPATFGSPMTSTPNFDQHRHNKQNSSTDFGSSRYHKPNNNKMNHSHSDSEFTRNSSPQNIVTKIPSSEPRIKASSFKPFLDKQNKVEDELPEMLGPRGTKLSPPSLHRKFSDSLYTQSGISMHNRQTPSSFISSTENPLKRSYKDIDNDSLPDLTRKRTVSISPIKPPKLTLPNKATNLQVTFSPNKSAAPDIVKPAKLNFGNVSPKKVPSPKRPILNPATFIGPQGARQKTLTKLSKRFDNISDPPFDNSAEVHTLGSCVKKSSNGQEEIKADIEPIDIGYVPGSTIDLTKARTENTIDLSIAQGPTIDLTKHTQGPTIDLTKHNPNNAIAIITEEKLEKVEKTLGHMRAGLRAIEQMIAEDEPPNAHKPILDLYPNIHSGLPKKNQSNDMNLIQSPPRNKPHTVPDQLYQVPKVVNRPIIRLPYGRPDPYIGVNIPAQPNRAPDPLLRLVNPELKKTPNNPLDRDLIPRLVIDPPEQTKETPKLHNNNKVEAILPTTEKVQQQPHATFDNEGFQHYDEEAFGSYVLPPPPPPVTIETTRDEVRKQILEMFPDVEVDFLIRLIMMRGEPPPGVEAQAFLMEWACNQLLERPYPKTKPKERVPSSATASYTASVDSVQAADVNYYSEDAVKTVLNPNARKQGLDLISNEFRKLSLMGLRQIYEAFNSHYAATRKAVIDGVEAVGYTFLKVDLRYGKSDKMNAFDVSQGYLVLVNAETKTEAPAGTTLKIRMQAGSNIFLVPIKSLKSGRPLKTMSMFDEQLLREVRFVNGAIQKEVEKNDHIVADNLNKEEYEEAGQLIECGCCYGEVPFDTMVQCYDGHLFCEECLRRYAQEAVFGQGQSKLTCMSDGCDMTFPMAQLKKTLPDKTLAKYEERCQEEAINLADMENLVRCPAPECDFAALMDEGDKVFKCQNSSCMKECCRYCKTDWKEHFGIPCNEIEKTDETKIRLKFEEQMTAAKVRSCHKCKTGITKSDGCNKMTCRCGAKMCYICRAPNIDYNHFCRHMREPGKKCAQCTACSLWTNPEEDDERAVKQIKEDAEKARKAEGYTDDKLIGAPEEPAAKKRKSNGNRVGNKALYAYIKYIDCEEESATNIWIKVMFETKKNGEWFMLAISKATTCMHVNTRIAIAHVHLLHNTTQKKQAGSKIIN